jgi:type IV secretory pathway VirB10-like protein
MSGTSPGDRGVSPVAGNKKPLVSKKAASVGIIVAACGIVTWMMWKHSNPAQPPMQERLPERLGVDVPYQAPVMVMPAAISQPAPERAPSPQPQPLPALVLPKTEPMKLGLGNMAAPPAPKPYMLTFADTPRTPSGDPPNGAAANAQGGGEKGSDIVYAKSSLDGIKAGLMDDQTLLLMPGLIQCYLDTAVNSTFPGPIQCHITADIRPHGVTLLDRGSIIHGNYANNIQTGQARLFVAADWIEDDVSGCFVKLDNAPIADSIGQTGAAGNIDTHDWERFSAAFFLTGAQMGESLGQAALSKGGQTYLSLNTGGGGLDSLAN